MNTHRPDDEPLPGEDELAALYRKLPRKEPGPALDAAVLRAAARAVESDAPATKRRARWPVALGSAAVLVLAAGLGWRMRDMPASAPPAAPAAVTVQESAQAPAAAPAMANAAVDIATAQQAATKRTAAGQSGEVAGAMSPAEAPVLAQRAMAARQRKPEASAPPASPAGNQAADTQQLAAADHASEAAPAMAPAPAPQPPVVAAQRMAAAPAMAPAPAPAADIGIARDAADTPAQELDKIRRLFSAHRREEARQRLADFHRDHPDYPLPDDLRGQLLTP